MHNELVQILAACPSCRVEAAVLELVELRARDSLVVEGRCRMCGRWERGGQVMDPGIRFVDHEQVRAALVRWASTEGETDIHAFVASGFGGLDVAGVGAALLGGRSIETSFDVIAWLFPGMAGGGSGGTAMADPLDLARAAEAGARGGGGVLARSPAGSPQAVPTHEVATPPDQRLLALKALAAVMLADGEIQHGEQAFLEGFARRAGLARLDPALIRPWRPTDLGFPKEPEPILDAMVDLAFIDRERDGSEWRVVREFARHWGVSIQRIEDRGHRKEHEVASAMTRLWRSLRRLLVTETVG